MSGSSTTTLYHTVPFLAPIRIFVVMLMEAACACYAQECQEFGVWKTLG